MSHGHPTEPWLGNVPAHWRVMKVGLAGSILMGRQRAPQYERGDHMTPYLRVANVLDGFIDYSDILEMNFEPAEQALFALSPAGTVQAQQIVGDADLDLARPGWRFILNPGSVGQPRDDDPRAAFLLIDTDRGTASWRRVEYDIAATQQQMRDAKLPGKLTDRLAYGR